MERVASIMYLYPGNKEEYKKKTRRTLARNERGFKSTWSS